MSNKAFYKIKTFSKDIKPGEIRKYTQTVVTHDCGCSDESIRFYINNFEVGVSCENNLCKKCGLDMEKTANDYIKKMKNDREKVSNLSKEHELRKSSVKIDYV